MNFFIQLTSFYTIAVSNRKFTANHVSLYLAILYLWNKNFFVSPIDIYRDTILGLSKIGSTHTYYKCIKDLDSWYFIKYEPSTNGIIASKVYIHEFDEETIQKIFVCLSNIDTSNAQVLAQALSKINTSNSQALHPYINNINNELNITNNNINTDVSNSENEIYLEYNQLERKEKEKKVATKKEKVELPFQSEKFLELWTKLLAMPKWKKKPIVSIEQTILKISNYQEKYVIDLLEAAISNSWQGIIFPNSDMLYANWLQTQNKNEHGNTKSITDRTPRNTEVIYENIQPSRDYKKRF